MLKLFITVAVRSSGVFTEIKSFKEPPNDSPLPFHLLDKASRMTATTVYGLYDLNEMVVSNS